jgi:hypothetical protein
VSLGGRRGTECPAIFGGQAGIRAVRQSTVDATQRNVVDARFATVSTRTYGFARRRQSTPTSRSVRTFSDSASAHLHRRVSIIASAVGVRRGRLYTFGPRESANANSAVSFCVSDSRGNACPFSSVLHTHR